MENQWVMFIVGPVHARDHDPGCSVAGVGTGREAYWRVLLCSLSGTSKMGASSPRETPEGPQVEPRF